MLQCVCCSNVCYPLHDSLRQRVEKAQWNSRDNNRATFNPGQRKHANVCENVSLSDVSCSPPAHGTQTRGIVQQGDTPQMFSFISNVHGLPKQLCTNNTVPGGERRRLTLHSHIIRSGKDRNRRIEIKVVPVDAVIFYWELLVLWWMKRCSHMTPRPVSCLFDLNWNF